MRYFAPQGTTISAASGPGSTATFVGGFGSQGLNIPPGASATFSFTASPPISASNNGSLHVSSDCFADVTGSLSGPVAAPCRCISLTGRIVPKTIKLTNPGERGGLHMEFSVSWFMNCTTGTGGCNGKFELLPPQPALKLGARLKPINGRINCSADCGNQAAGVMHFTLIAGPALGNPRRDGKGYTLTMKRTCQGVQTTSQKFRLVFNKIGLVDKKKSKLK